MSDKTLTPKAANKRYFSRMFGAACGYVGSVFGVSFLIDKGDPVTVVTILAALIPGFFVLMMLWAVWRFVNEVDEVARHDLTQAMLVALFSVLAISGGWGLVELFNTNLPRLPVFWVFPVFFLIFGFVNCFRFGRIV